ncbi:hypothetical protein D3C78_1591310 [compost metagenome]
MHHGIGLVLAENALDCGALADIHLLEGIPRAGTGFGQGLEVASVGQLVEVDHIVCGVADDVANDRRADETGATGDEDFH